MHIKQVLIDRGIPFSEENCIVICNEERLILYNKQITSLDGFVFNGNDLYLHHNQITSLDGFTFNGSILFLRHNQITSLDGFNFNGNNLYLHNNPINIERTITREIWERDYSDPYVNMFLKCSKTS